MKHKISPEVVVSSPLGHVTLVLADTSSPTWTYLPQTQEDYELLKEAYPSADDGHVFEFLLLSEDDNFQWLGLVTHDGDWDSIETHGYLPVFSKVSNTIH